MLTGQISSQSHQNHKICGGYSATPRSAANSLCIPQRQVKNVWVDARYNGAFASLDESNLLSLFPQEMCLNCCCNTGEKDNTTVKGVMRTQCSLLSHSNTSFQSAGKHLRCQNTIVTLMFGGNEMVYFCHAIFTPMVDLKKRNTHAAHPFHEILRWTMCESSPHNYLNACTKVNCCLKWSRTLNCKWTWHFHSHGGGKRYLALSLSNCLKRR